MCTQWSQNARGKRVRERNTNRLKMKERAKIGCLLLRQTRRVGGENSKFNSFYYYSLIPEITNKVRYMMQQSDQANYNEYRRKKRVGVKHFYVMCTYLKGSLLRKKKITQIMFSLEFLFAFQKSSRAILNKLCSRANY